MNSSIQRKIRDHFRNNLEEEFLIGFGVSLKDY